MSDGGRVLAIGDIHGCIRALDSVLDMVRPAAGDLVVTLGDYIDRGPDSRAVIDRLIDLGARTRLVTLRGNHEEMILSARGDEHAAHLWLFWGGRATLESYGGEVWSDVERVVPEAHWAFFEATADSFETDDHLFVHASVDPDLPLEEQPADKLRWEQIRRGRPHCSGKLMICGHTRQVAGVPLDLGHAICVDTWVYGEGWLSCLDVRTREVHQANQRGERRVISLE
jgi:serine/threonine protein phosphatase 1